MWKADDEAGAEVGYYGDTEDCFNFKQNERFNEHKTNFNSTTLALGKKGRGRGYIVKLFSTWTLCMLGVEGRGWDVCAWIMFLKWKQMSTRIEKDIQPHPIGWQPYWRPSVPGPGQGRIGTKRYTWVIKNEWKPDVYLNRDQIGCVMVKVVNK